MKFRIDRDTLADAVAWTARSLPNRPSVPVLAGLLIEAAADGLTLSGFDYETSTRATLPAEVSADGRALVSGRLLAEIVKSLPPKPVEVTLDSTKVQVVCGNARFSLQTMPVEEYPQLPDMPTASGTIKADDFANAVAQASAAAGRDEMLRLLTLADYENPLACFKLADAYVPGAQPKYRVAASLDKLGRVAEAVAAYEAFLSFVGPTPDDKFKEIVADSKTRHAALKATPSKVKIATTPAALPNMKVTVDGVAQMGPELTLAPGKHTIVVTADRKSVV